MALLLSLLMALVVVSCGPVPSLGCDLPQSRVLVSRKTFVLLGQMGRTSPFSCLKDRADFRFPREMVDGSQIQKSQAMFVLHETLQQIFNLFHPEGSAATWNTTILEQLLSTLHRQLEDLEACLLQEMGEEESLLGMEGPELSMRRYFQGIHLYLQEKKHSDCAWDVVRMELRRCLVFITQLEGRLRCEKGGLGSS